ncbi:hypothetical protein BCV69DRAFT_281276 [Microstroma glucosiphilum]|uniref:Uncharacterized protein n=1 Tax=Pseudomicrostroma glucosiphilum TaxID=1684307 RepID=A0A316UAL8_9BASI|nr:hypothetical protein BCV69DRAFT_281276 [Pseudomicrostroma glucosiphilum]PWN22270.1 hypothetical protein BCV69DRAFT_281276 [Pseudomicrostroma glucosiphilum]
MRRFLKAQGGSSPLPLLLPLYLSPLEPSPARKIGFMASSALPGARWSSDAYEDIPASGRNCAESEKAVARVNSDYKRAGREVLLANSALKSR